jgi:hypothetical protein
MPQERMRTPTTAKQSINFLAENRAYGECQLFSATREVASLTPG